MKEEQRQTLKGIMNNIDGVELKEKHGGRFHFRLHMNDHMRSTPLEALELGQRSYNCLKRAGYSTIGELVDAISGGQELKGMDFTEAIKKAVGLMNEDNHLEAELERLEGLKSKESLRKAKIVQKISTLDPDDDLYDEMYSELQTVLRQHIENLNEVETQIRKTTIAIQNAENGIVTAKMLEEYIRQLMDDMDKLSMEQERDLMRSLLQSVEIFPEQQPNGAWVKRLTFKMPIVVDGEEFTDMVNKSGKFDDYDTETGDEKVSHPKDDTSRPSV